MNFSELMPVMNINLSGDYPMEQLHEYAKHLEERIEDLPEINKVEIRGVPEREVRISLDLYQLEALQLNFDDIANAVRSENLTMSGGEILTGGQRRSRARDRRVHRHGPGARHRGEERGPEVKCAWATSPMWTSDTRSPKLRPRIRQARGDAGRDQARRREPARPPATRSRPS
jgi:multidrug efflux pump subunit AcrB